MKRESAKTAYHCMMWPMPIQMNEEEKEYV